MNSNFMKPSQQTQQLQQSQWNTLETQVDAKQLGGFSKDSPIFQKLVLSSQIRQSILDIKYVRRVQFTCNLILSDNGNLGGSVGCTVKGYSLYSHEKSRSGNYYFIHEVNCLNEYTPNQIIPGKKMGLKLMSRVLIIVVGYR